MHAMVLGSQRRWRRFEETLFQIVGKIFQSASAPAAYLVVLGSVGLRGRLALGSGSLHSMCTFR